MTVNHIPGDSPVQVRNSRTSSAAFLTCLSSHQPGNEQYPLCIICILLLLLLLSIYNVGVCKTTNTQRIKNFSLWSENFSSPKHFLIFVMNFPFPVTVSMKPAAVKLWTLKNELKKPSCHDFIWTKCPSQSLLTSPHRFSSQRRKTETLTLWRTDQLIDESTNCCSSKIKS